MYIVNHKVLTYSNLQNWVIYSSLLKKLILITYLCRLPSVLEILIMIPEGMFSPFLYLLDILKDSVQLVFIINAVHGVQNVFEHWSSFSSVVSKETKQTIFWQPIYFCVSLGNMDYFFVYISTFAYCCFNKKKCF